MTTLTSIVRASGFATTAQGALADTAVQPNDSPTFGNITATGTVDGVNIAEAIPATLGTAAQVLTVNAGATAGEWAAAGGGGGGGSMTHVSTTTVSGTSTSAVALTMDNTYKTYKLYTNYAQNVPVAGQIYVRLTDGGTPITTTVYNGYRAYNGGGFVINTQNFMACAGGTGSGALVIQEWTIYMDGNDIEVMRYAETSWATPTASSPTSNLGDSGYMLNSSYSASGNIDGLSFTTPNAVFAPGSTFILYGLAE